MRRHAWVEIFLLIVAITSALGVIAAYAFAFKALPWGAPTDWASFGDYVGGVLNPIIGVLTVVLIVLTLRTTRNEALNTRLQMEDQINLLKAQQISGDMQKRLDGVLAEWNRQMDQQVSPDYKQRAFVTPADTLLRKLTVRDVLENRKIYYELARAKSAHDEVAAQARYVAPTWKAAFVHLLPLLSELDDYCIEYEQLTGSTTLTRFYKARVATAVRSLGAAGIMADSTYARLMNE